MLQTLTFYKSLSNVSCPARHGAVKEDGYFAMEDITLLAPTACLAPGFLQEQHNPLCAAPLQKVQLHKVKFV